MRANRRRPRVGSVLPMLGVCLIGLIAFVGLAVDLGMLAVARTEAQNAADVAALVATRTLNNKPGATNNDLAGAVALAKVVATSNPHLSTYFKNSEIAKIEVGQYMYNPTTQTFSVSTWTDVTNSQTVTPPSGSWTAMQITISTSEPTYFMKALGVNSMPGGARAVAVYRPRDVSFVLDMTGSMAYSCTFNTGTVQDTTMRNQSLNPDDMYPTFGHYVATNSKLYASANQANSGGEAFPRNNYCIATPGGPPLIRNFYFDPANVSSPGTVAFPVTSTPSILKNAFHRWSPPESGADSNTYTPPVYDFTGYNAYHNGTESNPKGPTPAPYNFKTMTDSSSPSITYVGDRWRRANGAINKTDTTWSGTTNRPAYHAADLLGYGSTPPTSGVSPTFSTDWSNFRDPVWEMYGYDLDIPKYRAARGSNGPLNPATYLANNGSNVNNILVPAADRYQGFSMGPGYWGKTFYIWPPDPRTPVGNPGDSNYQPGDWRLRYFLNRSGNSFNPQGDNNPNTTGTGNIEGVNEVLLRNAAGLTLSAFGSTSSPNWRINYPAVLRWIKSGPRVLPPNLRAGRVLFYSSIPDDVNTGSGTTQERLDKAFWKNYIDYVFGWNYTSANMLYGTGDSWSSSTVSIMQNDMTTYRFSWESTAVRPYMRYTDSPSRPRLHFWFGPLSMVDFIGYGRGGNWNPGTTYEAHCWQLKAGMSSVLDDIRNNHPNDFVCMTMFAAPAYNGVRVPIGQDFVALKNALFYPKSLLPIINAGDTTTELRPYDVNFTPVAGDEIPNANGSTDPNTGLAYAFNMLSPAAALPTAEYGTIKGRRGASKIVIFETDGVPNTYRSMTFNMAGYNSYYTVGASSGNVGNGNSTAMNEAYKVIQQIRKPMASTTTTGTDSGLSLPNAPARVYPIAFGDLFDEDLAPAATFRPTALNFMATCAFHGGTGPSGATTLPSNQIITGPYAQRITRLRDCLEAIFQSGVSVTLIE